MRMRPGTTRTKDTGRADPARDWDTSEAWFGIREKNSVFGIATGNLVHLL